jgi:peptidoglycan/LPS O-acetylase OafA/YrhL
MRLSEYARSRDNNFTLLRLLAAFTVVLYHSWSALGIGGRDFAYDYVGREIAEMALDMLFVTSGFLVTASLFNRGDLTHFLWARALRLFPAMWLMVPLTVFVLAPALTTLPVKDYLESPTTWEYVRKTATVVGGVRWSLPGVFDTLPLKGEFNGSLWTLPIEARMYIYLAVGWIAFAWWPQIRVRTLSYVAPIAAAVMFVVILRARAQGVLGNGNVEIFMFFMGSSLYFWREKLFMNRVTFVALPLIVIAASLLIGPSVAFPLYLLCVAPFMLHLAYIPGGPIRRFNSCGDYSYGVYIYAFPVQQTLALLFPKITILAMAGSAAVISFALAFCSWNLVEKRAMGLKDVCAEATTRALSAAAALFARWRGDPKPSKLSPSAPSDAPASHPSGAISVSSGK